MRLLVAFLLSFVCLAALGQEVDGITDIIKLTPAFIAALSGGKHLLAGSIGIMIGTYVFRRYVMSKLKLGKGVLPIVSGVLGLAGAWAASVYGGATAEEAKMLALSGPVAGTLWSSVGKYLFKKL